MTRRIALVITGIIVAVLLSLLWYRSAHAPQTASDVPVVFFVSPDGDEVELPVEVADDPEERARGLMGRDSLPAGQGMIFIFDDAQDLSFWMKNTRIPLDILFFDAEGLFVSRTTMEPCTVVVCPVYPSDRPSKWAIEVNAGESKTADIGPGWRLKNTRE